MKARKNVERRVASGGEIPKIRGPQMHKCTKLDDIKWKFELFPMGIDLKKKTFYFRKINDFGKENIQKAFGFENQMKSHFVK